MKSHVESELTIPQQTRYLVSIEMGPVERHVCVFQMSWEGSRSDCSLIGV